MIDNEKIHAFAVKWFAVFRNTRTANLEIEESSFVDECSALGFEMDCGKAFAAAYPESKVLSDYGKLDEIIDSVDDIPLLGSAIFSKWSYFVPLASPGADCLSAEDRAWFVVALGRLERLFCRRKKRRFR